MAEQKGQRIDNYLIGQLKNVPKSRIYKMIRRGEVRINGGRVKAPYKICIGDRVRIPPVEQPIETDSSPAVPAGGWFAGGVSLETLYEDEGLLVVNKPAGMAVHGGSGLSHGVIEALRATRDDRYLELVHRLDRDTSGCLAIAKSRRTLLACHALLRQGDMHKQYQLLVVGTWPKQLRQVNLALHKFVTQSGERRVRVAVDGKPSRTDFETLAKKNQATRLKAILHTGRTHQIRVHASASGHTILGDQKYGSDDQLVRWKQQGIRSLCLHASTLRIPTEDGSQIKVQSPVPELFEQTWAGLN